MAWEENPRICLHMQLIAILSRTGVILDHRHAVHFRTKKSLAQVGPRRIPALRLQQYPTTTPTACVAGHPDGLPPRSGSSSPHANGRGRTLSASPPYATSSSHDWSRPSAHRASAQTAHAFWDRPPTRSETATFLLPTVYLGGADTRLFGLES